MTARSSCRNTPLTSVNGGHVRSSFFCSASSRLSFRLPSLPLASSRGVSLPEAASSRDVEPCAGRGALRLVTSAAAEASRAAVVDGSCWRVAVAVDDSAWPAARAAAAGAAGARSVAAAHAALAAAALAPLQWPALPEVPAAEAWLAEALGCLGFRFDSAAGAAAADRGAGWPPGSAKSGAVLSRENGLYSYL